MRLRLGTSGWSYPGGRGTWNGIFYPRREDRDRGFDELRFYAERFNSVEVNSTFYGQPRARAALEWVRRTPEDFQFSVKLHQKFTHPGMAADPGPLTRGDIDAFKGGIDPLTAASKLGALLVQFPSSFHATPEARGYLDWLLRTFREYPLAVELRHRSWSDQPGETRDLLRGHDAAWVQIDEPKFDSSVRQDFEPHESTFMYIRLHGRNAAQWWDHEHAEDRYNYVYSVQELRPIAEKVRAASRRVTSVYLYMNNHFSAQAVANAVMLRQLLGEPATAAMPAELIDRYPELQGIVATLPPSRLL